MIQLLGIVVFALLLYLGQKYVYAKIWQRDLKVSLSFREDGIWEGQESELPEIINMCDNVCVIKAGRMTGMLGREELDQERIMQYAAGGEE